MGKRGMDFGVSGGYGGVVEGMKMQKAGIVYLLASKRNGTLYVGVTSHLVQRIWQHREEVMRGFTEKYGVKLLVWYEVHEDMLAAITREKQIKAWKRAWKIRLIEESNPTWRDLYDEIV
jgi:putative endonuclease